MKATSNLINSLISFVLFSIYQHCNVEFHSLSKWDTVDKLFPDQRLSECVSEAKLKLLQSATITIGSSVLNAVVVAVASFVSCCCWFNAFDLIIAYQHPLGEVNTLCPLLNYNLYASGGCSLVRLQDRISLVLPEYARLCKLPSVFGLVWPGLVWSALSSAVLGGAAIWAVDKNCTGQRIPWPKIKIRQQSHFKSLASWRQLSSSSSF